jgi:hypothetical protein
MRKPLPLHRRVGRFIARNHGLLFANLAAATACALAISVVFGPYL